jgi:hypothetical protein
MAEIALKIVQLIESAHTGCILLYNSPVVRQILWQLRTASLCDLLYNLYDSPTHGAINGTIVEST